MRELWYNLLFRWREFMQQQQQRRREMFVDLTRTNLHVRGRLR